MGRVSLLVLVLLAGCGKTTDYVKDGSSQAQVEADFLACEEQSFEIAPVSKVEDDTLNGVIKTRDENLGLRARAERQCMVDLGYERVIVDR